MSAKPVEAKDGIGTTIHGEHRELGGLPEQAELQIECDGTLRGAERSVRLAHLGKGRAGRKEGLAREHAGEPGGKETPESRRMSARRRWPLGE